MSRCVCLRHVYGWNYIYRSAQIDDCWWSEHWTSCTKCTKYYIIPKQSVLSTCSSSCDNLLKHFCGIRDVPRALYLPSDLQKHWQLLATSQILRSGPSDLSPSCSSHTNKLFTLSPATCYRSQVNRTGSSLDVTSIKQVCGWELDWNWIGMALCIPKYENFIRIMACFLHGPWTPQAA
jgi:hypothetical protein